MNRGMRVLQTLALPLGYVTVSAKVIILYQHAGCQERNAELPELAAPIIELHTKRLVV